MGILKQIRAQLRAQSSHPRPTRRGPPALPMFPGNDMSIEMGGRYGTVGPENHHIVRDLENPWGNKRSSVEGWDLQKIFSGQRLAKLMKFLEV